MLLTLKTKGTENGAEGTQALLPKCTFWGRITETGFGCQAGCWRLLSMNKLLGKARAVLSKYRQNPAVHALLHSLDSG